MRKEKLPIGVILADCVAKFGGSWAAIIACVLLIIIWICINTWVMLNPIDPFPYILLNLLLSCIAALQAPFILMAANRQQEKDRVSLEEDLAIDRRSEKAINEINKKIDNLQRLLIEVRNATI